MDDQARLSEILASRRRFRIVPKRDFGSGPGYWVKGRFVKSGFVVTDGFCNIMPGATWFYTIADALDGIERFIRAEGNAAAFWASYRPAEGRS